MARVKNFFKKVGLWFKNHAPTRRRIIQVYAALLCNANIKGFFGKGNNIIYRGGTKNICTPGLNCYSCPGAVAACPLGALQNALASSGTRTPYYILGILGLLGLMLGRTICGFLCPVGLGQELLYKIKTPKLKKSRYTRILSYFKYILLIVCVVAIPIIYQGIPAFCKYICPAGTFGGAGGLLSNPNNSDFFAMLGYLFSWKFILLVIFVVLSIFIFRFFCRFICPLGAIYGFFNKIALIGVKLDKEKCVDCGLCVQTCKMDIKHVGDHECINCGECISVCPTKAITWKGSKIFLHGAQVETEAAPSINAILANGTTANATATVEVVESAPIAVKEDVKTIEVSKTQSDKDFERKIKKRSFWLQFSAWALAIAVLITALVYYNFLAPTNNSVVYRVGDKCPDFTLETVYKNAGSCDEEGNQTVTGFSILESQGKVTVINYWETTCDPCKEELPWFEEIYREYDGAINMVAIHNYMRTENVQTFIDKNALNLSEYTMLLALDIKEDSYTMLGGKGAYPLTVVLDSHGVISFVHQGKLEDSILRNAIVEAMEK
ncbi:MAG: 4Fe-4S binding protein [Clostridia bacterium]|nr:4Fe-4S binding protein [Clostridia bacterium]